MAEATASPSALLLPLTLVRNFLFKKGLNFNQMLHNQIFKIFAYSTFLSWTFCSCSDLKTDKKDAASKEVLQEENFPPLPEENKNLEPKFQLPKVEMKKIKKLKEDGPYGFSEFYYYIYSNFKSLNTYEDEGATEGFELYGCNFQGGIKYETSIHLDKPRHFIESFTLPSVETDSLLKTLSLIYPDFKFDCQDDEKYCEYSSYEPNQVRTVFFQTRGESSKIGISYRKEY
jgi:hypothetical protein